MAAKKRKVRMKDIAEAADVSVATVSYVLNGKGRISPEKQQEIWELLQQAGFRPKYYRYPIFYIADYCAFDDRGMLRPWMDRVYGMNSFFHQKDLSFRTEFLRSKQASPIEDQLLEICRSRPCAVIVDMNLADHCGPICEFFESKAVPAVQIGYYVQSHAHDACAVDNFAGGYEAAKHFLAKGHDRIGVIRWDEENDPASPQKFAGFTCALQEAGRSLPEKYIAHCPVHRDSSESIPSRTAALSLAEMDQPPTAVFVENSYMSPALIYPMSSEERQVPEAIRQLDMIHFEAWDLLTVENIMRGKLAYDRDEVKLLRTNWEELGRMAATRAHSRIADRDIPAGETFRLAPKLDVSETAYPS